MISRGTIGAKRLGASEVVGTLFLIGAVMAGMIIVSLILFSQPSPTRVPVFDSIISNESKAIYLYHKGGDALRAGEYRILVDSEDRTKYFQNSAGLSPDDLNWSVGQTLSYTSPTLPGRVIIIFTQGGSEGSILASQDLVGVWIPPAAEQTPHKSPFSVDWYNSPVFGNASTPFQFTDTSTGSDLTDFFWDYNDANTTTTQSPSHPFPCNTGADYCLYSINHSVTNAGGTPQASTSWLNRSLWVTVYKNLTPTVTFTNTTGSGNSPLAVTFTAAQHGAILVDSWYWTFGDGGTSDSQNPTHTYTSAGTFTVSLTATNYTLGVATVTNANYISVSQMNWYNCDWPYRKNITIDHTKVRDNLVNFPVLIKFTSDDDLRDRAGQDDGGDILFVNATGYKLSHEIEYFSRSNGALVAWVRVPTLSSITDTNITMYYGNSTKADQWNANGVWDGNYKGVWHLKESGSGAADEFKDSTSNNDHGRGGDGASGNTPTMTTSGMFGNAQSFDGLDWITMKSHPTPSTQMTLEAWVYVGSPTTNQKVVGDLDPGTWDHGYLLGLGDGSPNMYPEVYDTTSTLRTYKQGTISSNTWTHLVANWTTNVRFGGYINGIQVTGTGTIPNNIGVSDLNLRVGIAPWDASSTGFPLTGRIDEVRISDIARSPAWILTEYENMKNFNTFYTRDNQVESTAAGCPAPSPPPAGQSWYSCDWRYRQNITILHTQVVTDLTNFPVLVNFTTNNGLRDSNAQANGNDILFINATGYKLSHEIEYFNKGYGGLTAWVKVPQLSSTTDTNITMYYGNSTIGSQQDAENVWEGNYKAVWHLSADFLDSTSNNNDITNSGTTSALGKMANARYFDGASYLTKGDTSSLDMTAGQDFTVSAWVKTTQGTAANAWPAMMRKVNDATRTKGYGLYLHEQLDARWYFETEESAPPGGYYAARGNNIADGTWHYIAGVRTGSTLKAYEDDTNPGTQAASAGDLSNANSFRLGANCMATPDNLFFIGSLDEVRVSKFPRSAGWIHTEYHNQGSPTTFYTVSNPEAASGCPSAPPAYVQSANRRTSSANPTITLPGSSTTGNFMVVSVVTPSTVSSVTDSNSNIYNRAIGPTNIGGWGNLYIYYAPITTGGSTITVTVHLAGYATNNVLFAAEYSGVAATNPLDRTSGASGATGYNLYSGSALTTQNTELICGFLVSGPSQAYPGPSYTQRETNYGHIIVDRVVSSTGTYEVTGTQGSSGEWACQMATFKGA